MTKKTNRKSSSTEGIPDTTLSKHLERALSSADLLRFRIDYVTSGLLDHTEALFLSDIIDQSYKNPRDADRWFPCSIDCLKNSLCWTVAEQKKYLKKMKEKGFVEVCYRGLPRTRHLRVDLFQIELAVDEMEDTKRGE